MRELIPTIRHWLSQDKQISLATVVKVKGSSPRPEGSKIIVSSQGEMLGSVSGGCVEGSVVEEALQCMKNNQPKLLSYGIDNSSPWSVGLACGGKIEVFVEPLFNPSLPAGFTQDFFIQLNQLIQTEEPFVMATITAGEYLGEKGLYTSNGWIIGDPSKAWCKYVQLNNLTSTIESGKSRTISMEFNRSAMFNIFIEPVLPPARLVIIGAVHIAAALINYARELGYKTIVIDPRSAFLTHERFPAADELLHAWPQEAFPNLNLRHTDCVAVLSHDEKIDVPALQEALRSPAGYIGLLGSLKTRNERFSALKTASVTDQELTRIHAPIGLDIGALEPEEIALSVMAEIVANQRKKK